MARLSITSSRHSKNRPAQGRSRCNNPTAAARTRAHAADDFLRQRFEPVIAATIPPSLLVRKSEWLYMQSMQYVSQIHPCQIAPLSTGHFPINIYQHFQAFKEKFEQHHELEVCITGTIQQPCIATSKELDIGFDLYYVPLKPLFTLLSKPASQPLGNLLLSVYHYLYNAGVTLCNPSSYIGYEMQMIKESYEDNADEFNQAEMAEGLQEASEIIQHCEMLSPLIASLQPCLLFSERLQGFQPADKEKKLLEAITKIHDLREEFPGYRFTDRLPHNDRHDYEDQRMYPEQYLTFFWGGDASFDDQLGDWINSSLNETTGVKSPISVQVFDQPREQPTHEFAFEEQFLKCIEQLNTALYEFSSD